MSQQQKHIDRLERWYGSKIDELEKRRSEGGLNSEHYARLQTYYGEVYLRERLRLLHQHLKGK